MAIGTFVHETSGTQLIETLLLALELHIAAILAELIHTTVPMEIGFAIVQEGDGKIQRLRGLVMQMGELAPPKPGAERSEEGDHASHPVHALSLVLSNEGKANAIVGLNIKNPGLTAMPASEKTEEIDPTKNLLRDGFTHGGHSLAGLCSGHSGCISTHEHRRRCPCADDGAHESHHDDECPLWPETGFVKGMRARSDECVVLILSLLI